MSSPKHMLHAVISPPKALDLEAMKPVLNQAEDWVHYLPGALLIKTSRSASVWYKRLKAGLPDGAHIFIVRVDLLDRGGWLPKWVWEWIQGNTPEA